jgi:transcriptional regulator with GAF, ATPase, and Fis domain
VGIGHPASELTQTPERGFVVFINKVSYEFFIIMLLNNKDNSMDVITGISLPMWGEIGLAAGALGVGFIVGLFRQFLVNRKKSKQSKEIDWQIHSQIHELLTELRVSSDSARSQLIQFHNGEYFMDGVSMRKMSLTHESVSKGVSVDGDRLHGLLMTLFTPLIGKVLEDKPVLHHTKQDKDSFSKNFFLAENVDSYIVLPIRHENKTSGYLIVQWGSPSKTKSIEKNIEYISKIINETRNQIQVQLDEQLRSQNG